MKPQTDVRRLRRFDDAQTARRLIQRHAQVGIVVLQRAQRRARISQQPG